VLFESDQDVGFDSEGLAQLRTYVAYGAGLEFEAAYSAEGENAVCVSTHKHASWWIDLSVVQGSAQPVDLSIFEGGTVDFELLADQSVDVELAWLDEATPKKARVSSTPYTRVSHIGDGWLSVSIPLCAFAGLNLERVTSAAGFIPRYAPNEVDGRAHFCVDSLRWTRAGACARVCE
jgi:hypothetical protein